jgi:NitT/TauT family transport system permease protein
MGGASDDEAPQVIRRAVNVLDQVIVAFVLCVFWQLASMKLGHNAVPPPLGTFVRLSELFQTSNFWANVGATGWAVVIAGTIGAIGGAALGLSLGTSRFASELASPILVAIYALPKVVLYPIVLLLFGISLSAKVALGVLNGFAPVVIIAMEAVAQVNPSILRTGRVLHLTPNDMILRLLLPATLPEILTGIRIGLALTIVGVLIGEIFASNKGLGFMLANASQLNDNLTVMALTAFVVIAAMAINWLVAAASVLSGYGTGMIRH